MALRRLFYGVFLGVPFLSLVFGNFTLPGGNIRVASKRDLTLNGMTVFIEPYYERVLRTRAEAIDYCKEQDGELVKVVETKLLRRMLSSQDLSLSSGTYWIDGKLKGEKNEGVKNFELNTTCTNSTWGTPLPKLLGDKQSSELCLALVKAYYMKDSGIMVKNCENKYYAICSIPDNGCQAPMTVMRGK